MASTIRYGNGNITIKNEIMDETATGAEHIDGQTHVFGTGNAVVDINYTYVGPTPATGTLPAAAVVNTEFHLGSGNNSLTISSSLVLQL
jgi:hypothetical protein